MHVKINVCINLNQCPSIPHNDFVMNIRMIEEITTLFCSKYMQNFLLVIRVADLKSLLIPTNEGESWTRASGLTMSLSVRKFAMSYGGWESYTGISKERWSNKSPVCKQMICY